MSHTLTQHVVHSDASLGHKHTLKVPLCFWMLYHSHNTVNHPWRHTVYVKGVGCTHYSTSLQTIQRELKVATLVAELRLSTVLVNCVN